MSFIKKLKEITKSIFSKSNDENEIPDNISIASMEAKYENEDYMGAAKDLKNLLERYGRRKRKNHRYKGREFIYFILSNKHKDLKNIGYMHWKNLNKFFKLNQTKVYPYHKKNLRKAMTFFKNEIKGLSEINIYKNSNN
ncbi:MAG: hypothetical protein ACOCV1_02170 [Bacillota bacterium]